VLDPVGETGVGRTGLNRIEGIRLLHHDALEDGLAQVGVDEGEELAGGAERVIGGNFIGDDEALREAVILGRHVVPGQDGHAGGGEELLACGPREIGGDDVEDDEGVADGAAALQGLAIQPGSRRECLGCGCKGFGEVRGDGEGLTVPVPDRGGVAR